MSLHKEVKEFGMTWEEQYGYAQAVKVDDTIYVSGQFSHDDQGKMVGPAPLDNLGRILDQSNMEMQMRPTYANAKKILHKFGATLDDVADEVLYVTDMKTAFAVAGSVRKEASQEGLRKMPNLARDRELARNVVRNRECLTELKPMRRVRVEAIN